MGEFLEKASDALSLPAQALAGLPTVEIVGCRDVLVRGHRGLLKYSEQEVLLNCGGAALRLRGTGLVICAMSRDEIRLRGALSAVEFIL